MNTPDGHIGHNRSCHHFVPLLPAWRTSQAAQHTPIFCDTICLNCLTCSAMRVGIQSLYIAPLPTLSHNVSVGHNRRLHRGTWIRARKGESREVLRVTAPMRSSRDPCTSVPPKTHSMWGTRGPHAYACMRNAVLIMFPLASSCARGRVLDRLETTSSPM